MNVYALPLSDSTTRALELQKARDILAMMPADMSWRPKNSVLGSKTDRERYSTTSSQCATSLLKDAQVRRAIALAITATDCAFALGSGAFARDAAPTIGLDR